MKASIRNFAGIGSLDLDLSGVTLIAGRNAVGKSSVLEAIGAVATSQPLTRGQTTKKEGGPALLAAGAAAGSVTIAGEAWKRRIAYPSLAVETEGSVPPLGSALGIGLTRLSALDAKARAAALSERFALDPTEDDFTQAVLHADDIEMGDAEIAALWKRIQTSGWDAVAKSIREDGAKLKGKWEHVTGERWGDDKARRWCPAALQPEENYDLAAEEKALAEARKALEAAIAGTGISIAERGRLRLEAEGEQKARDQVEFLERSIAAADAKIAPLRERLAVAEREQRETAPLTCPHCKQAVRLSSTANSVPVLVAASVREAVDPLTTAAKIAEIKEEGKKITDQRRSETDALATWKANLARAQAAATKLAAMPEGDASAANRSAEARAEVDRLEKLVAAIKARAEAKQAATAVRNATHLIAILDPSGVRADAVRRGLADINDALAEHANRAGWIRPLIGPDMEILFGARPYRLCSESERWRCDLVITCALARAEGGAVVLVDRLDVLAPQDRGAPIQLLAKLGIASVIACTARDPSAVPDLGKNGLGRTVWLERGASTAARKEAA